MDVQTLIKRAGGAGKLARILGVKHNTVSHWKETGRLPAIRVLQINEVMRIPLAQLMPLVRLPPIPASKDGPNPRLRQRKKAA